MKDLDSERNAIERDLLILKEVEGAGVFRRTSLDSRALFVLEPDPGQGLLTNSARRWIGITAALALVVGSWGAMFAFKVGELRHTKLVANRTGPSAASVNGAEGILVCLGGPSAPALNRCRQHDYDSDGDVDLEDFQTYQLAFAGSVSGG